MHSDSHSRGPTHSTGRSKTWLAWGVVSALVPVVLAVVIVVGPALSSISTQEGIKSEPFVLDRPEGQALPESLAIVVDRNRRVRMLLRSEEAYLLAQQTEAQFARPVLLLDLQDSLAVLSIQGVPIRTSRILRMERSRLFEHLSNPEDLFEEFEAPMALVGARASIPRIPMRMVQAPKDTAEARLRPPDAFVAEERNVYAEMYFERNVALYLIAAEAGGGRLATMQGALNRRFRQALAAVRRLASRDSSIPPRWIRLEMSSGDIRAIYRALPENGRLAIRW